MPRHFDSHVFGHSRLTRDFNDNDYSLPFTTTPPSLPIIINIASRTLKTYSLSASVRIAASRHSRKTSRLLPFICRNFAQATPNFKMAAVIDTKAAGGSVVVMEKVG
jgi:hypothetical protein